ncbi:MAG: hypothetical protein ACI959_000809 [Limisphaerales bacterium]|jgi:hypothetical protein
MKSLKLIAAALIITVCGQLNLNAQVDFPAPSPSCKIEQKVGLTDVTLEFSRPSKKDRTVFGGLVPYNEMWRTGANASTKITFSTDVKLAGNDIPAGTYALYTMPTEGEWTIIIHKNTTHWGLGGSDYKAEEDLVRFSVQAQSLGRMVESFNIYVDDLRNNSATINITWDEAFVSIPLTIGTDENVLKEMEKALAGPDGRMYYSAASYLFNGKLDNNKAMEYINIAINDKDYERFWSLRLMSQIQAALGDYSGAIQSAEKSKTLATEEGNQDYVRTNTESIEEWTGLIKK